MDTINRVIKISDEDINAERYTDLKYVKVLRYFLETLYAWPGKEVGENVPRKRTVKSYIVLTIGIIYAIAGAGYIVMNQDLPSMLLGHNYITWMIHVVYMSRLMSAFRRRFKDVSAEFLMKIHLFHFRNKSEFAMETHIRVHKLSHIATIYLVSLMFFGLVLFNVIPIYTNFILGMFDDEHPANFTIRYEHAVYYILPFDYLTDFNGYLVVNALNWYISYYCSLGVCIIDLFLFLMVFHLWGHFKILLYDLASYPTPEGYIYSEAENLVVAERIKECINYHCFLTRFIKKMSAEFGPLIFIYHGCHLVMCCLLLLECSQMNPEALLRYGPLTVVIFQQLIQMSVVFEVLGTVSERLVEGVYDVPWECMDDRNRLLVQFFLMNTQKPVRVKALGVTDVGVTTMAGILKTSFSYFTFLRTVD